MPHPIGLPSTQSQRIIRVLQAFSSRARWGVRELAAELGISKSSLHRTIQDLADEGLLSVMKDGSYEATVGLLRLGATIVRSFDLSRVSQIHLEELRDKTGETAILTVYDSSRQQFAAVAAAESNRPVRYIWASLEEWSELHLGASGKAILAFLGPEEQRAVLDVLPDPLPGPKSWRKRTLQTDLTKTRARGWAESNGERFRGARGVAAPIRNHSGKVVGAVVIGWPNGPGEDRRASTLGQLSKNAADSISDDLGWDESQVR